MGRSDYTEVPSPPAGLPHTPHCFPQAACDLGHSWVLKAGVAPTPQPPSGPVSSWTPPPVHPPPQPWSMQKPIPGAQRLGSAALRNSSQGWESGFCKSLTLSQAMTILWSMSCHESTSNCFSENAKDPHIERVRMQFPSSGCNRYSHWKMCV